MKFFVNYVSDKWLTLILLVINVLVFVSYWSWDISAISFIRNGGNFAPFTLDKEGHRLFSSMFLHGNIFHLVMNAYSLFFLGCLIEKEFGKLRFLDLYFISGILAGLSSLVFNLFVVSVGASGAIFGLYGYFIIYSFEKADRTNRLSLLVNFIIYFAVVTGLGLRFNFDNAGHFGGVVAGICIRLLEKIAFFHRFGFRLILWPVVLFIYINLPVYQVEYFKSFQYFVKQDSKINSILHSNVSDQELLEKIKEVSVFTDFIRQKFRNVSRIPSDLHGDTTQIMNYLDLKDKQIGYYMIGIERESYIYIDSIQYTNALTQKLPPIKYPLYIGDNTEPPKEPDQQTDQLKLTQVFYDQDWYPTDEYDMVYYRIGYKDSVDDWHGKVEDYYRNGAVQMKGSYNHGLRDGIFIFYNRDSTYFSAGRFQEDDEMGKWEIFYTKNRLNFELRHAWRESVMLNFYDTLGNKTVVDGEGVEEYFYPSGKIRSKVNLKEGKREGVAIGYDESGGIVFKEFFESGRFVNGISYSEDGAIHRYDRSIHAPIPEGGYELFYEYLNDGTTLTDSINGRVRMRFDVHHDGRISSVRFMERLGEPYDSQAKQLLLEGPAWNPALLYGYKPYTTQTEVVVDFYQSN